MNEKTSLIDRLVGSQIFRDYERAFSEATGLPVALRPVECWQLTHHGRARENRFCAILSGNSRACGACLQVQQQLSETAGAEPRSVTCPAGLTDIAVPVRMGEQLIGFLQTGQVFRRAPNAAQFDKTAKLVAAWGVKVELEELRDAYFSGVVMNSRQHDSVVKLLTIFAQHLSLVCNQIAMQQTHSEPPVITKAKDYIRQHLGEDLSLGQVAKAVNTSSFYFCKIFKRSTGINFTDFLARLRIENAMNLLLNPNLRVSEIAYEVGFQSLTHFNRVFKRINGQSPTEYRAHLARN